MAAENVTPIRAELLLRLVRTAQELEDSEGDAGCIAAFEAQRPDFEVWKPRPGELSSKHLSAVATALARLERYSQARPWCELAVTEADRSEDASDDLAECLEELSSCVFCMDDHAEAARVLERSIRVREQAPEGLRDHHSIGWSAHEIGRCRSLLGDEAGARIWYERAVRELEQGGPWGQIDHDSVGDSCHEVGACLSDIGADASARPWYERAVREKQLGDIEGEIDHASLGSSLHELGRCISRLGAPLAKARRHYQAAVRERLRGVPVEHYSVALSM